jgi:hypothetical protein
MSNANAFYHAVRLVLIRGWNIDSWFALPDPDVLDPTTGQRLHEPAGSGISLRTTLHMGTYHMRSSPFVLKIRSENLTNRVVFRVPRSNRIL